VSRASTLADQGRLDEAAEVCEEEVRRAGPSVPALFLLGMIHQARGDLVKARSWLEKTVYLDPRHEDSLLALALLAERAGESAAAAGYRRRAERAFKEKSE
jgi:chemotaxis protein methyltransferase WspC